MNVEYHGPNLGGDESLQTIAWNGVAAPNPGLLFQRFMGLAPKPRSRQGKDTVKNETKEAIKQFAKRINHLDGAREDEYLGRLNGWHARMDHIARRATAQARFHHLHADAELTSPLISGGGYAHPLENALSFHHTLGVPYLPGSSLKGLTRSWLKKTGRWDAHANQMGYPNEPGMMPDGAYCGKRGEWVFMDALPIGQWPQIEVDIINCHLPEYYGNPPGEGSNPEAVPIENPIPVFLPVVGQKGCPSSRETVPKLKQPRALEFRFRVGSLDGKEETAQKGLTLLMEALDWLGAGAKTSVGYGGFRVPKAYRL